MNTDSPSAIPAVPIRDTVVPCPYAHSGVIAGLDPAIQEIVMNARNFTRQLDRRVKPGDDSLGVRWGERKFIGLF
jgi:hypothetical protein